MSHAASRSWALAVAAAVGAHVLLALVPIMDPREGAAATPPVVHLRLASARPEPVALPAPTEPRTPEATFEHVAAERPRAPRPAERAPAVAPLSTEEAEPLPPTPRTQALPRPEGLPDDLITEPPPPAPARVSAADADRDRAHYAALVRRAVEAEKQYPRRALKLSRQGVARVDVAIAADGSLAATPVLADSSGWKSLDREALRMVRAAAPFPRVPDTLAASPVTIRLPISFSLD
jgi:protein TonB